MPVFGIVPYRTEARTRSEARIQAEVDRLLLILKTVNEVIRTAQGRLIEWFRPPPVLEQRYPVPHRAPDRRFRITRQPGRVWGIVQMADGSYRWDEDYERDRTTSYHMSWGTIQ